MATLEITEKALRDLSKRLEEKIRPGIQFVVTNQARAILEQRIFVKQKATDSGGIGFYKNAYYIKRAGKKGRTVNLQLSGSLRQSIQVGTYQGGVALGYTNDKTLKYAKINEERYRNRTDSIFALNEKEVDEAVKAGQKYLDKEIDKWLATF